MNSSFEIIDSFIRDIYGFVFLTESIDARVVSNGLVPIQDAHSTVMSIIQEKRPPFADEFVEHVYPLLEVAVHWQQLKKRGGLKGEFVDACKKKMLNANAGNFFGIVFEVDMACRSLLSGWRTDFVEDCTKQRQSQIDFVFFRKGKYLAVDCRSLRFTGFFSAADLDIGKIESAVVEHAQKFKPEHLDKIAERLGIRLDERVLVMDITAHN